MNKDFEWWFFFWQSPLGKGIISIFRNGAIGMGGLIVSELVTLFTNTEMEPMTKLLIIGSLKIIDELLHKTGVAEKGITRF